MNQRREERVNILVTEGGIHAFPVAGHTTGRSVLRTKYQAAGRDYPSRPVYAGKGVAAASVLPRAVRDAVEPRSLAPESSVSTLAPAEIPAVYYPHEAGGRIIGDDHLPRFYD